MADQSISEKSQRSDHAEAIKRYVAQGVPEKIARNEIIAPQLVNDRLRRDLRRPLIDGKTGLLASSTYETESRQAFEDYVSGERTTFSELKLDFDRFSWYNDLFGDLFGDEVLKSAGQVIRSNIRVNEGDRGIRKGGEELYFILGNSREPSTYVSQAERLMREIRLRTLEGVVTVLRDNRRTVKAENGVLRKNRVVLQSVAGMIVENKVNNLETFVSKGKGTLSSKKAVQSYFHDHISQDQVDSFQFYALNNEPDNLLSETAKQKNSEIEAELVRVIKDVLVEVTCSGGMVVLGPKSKDLVVNPDQVTSELQSLTLASKTQEGGAGKSNLTVHDYETGEIYTEKI